MLGINYKALPLFLNQRPAFISRHPASEGDTGKGPATETAPSSGQVRLPVSAPGIAPHPDPMSSRTPDRTCAAVALGSLLEFSTAGPRIGRPWSSRPATPNAEACEQAGAHLVLRPSRHVAEHDSLTITGFMSQGLSGPHADAKLSHARPPQALLDV